MIPISRIYSYILDGILNTNDERFISEQSLEFPTSVGEIARILMSREQMSIQTVKNKILDMEATGHLDRWGNLGMNSRIRINTWMIRKSMKLPYDDRFEQEIIEEKIRARLDKAARRENLDMKEEGTLSY